MNDAPANREKDAPPPPKAPETTAPAANRPPPIPALKRSVDGMVCDGDSCRPAGEESFRNGGSER